MITNLKYQQIVSFYNFIKPDIIKLYNFIKNDSSAHFLILFILLINFWFRMTHHVVFRTFDINTFNVLIVIASLMLVFTIVHFVFHMIISILSIHAKTNYTLSKNKKVCLFSVLIMMHIFSYIVPISGIFFIISCMVFFPLFFYLYTIFFKNTLINLKYIKHNQIKQIMTLTSCIPLIIIPKTDSRIVEDYMGLVVNFNYRNWRRIGIILRINKNGIFFKKQFINYGILQSMNQEFNKSFINYTPNELEILKMYTI